MKKILAVVALSLLSLTAFAAEDGHDLGTITGHQIDLKTYDHAIAGSIKDFVVFGNVDEEAGLAELTMKKDGQVIKATFGRNEGKYGGTISHTKEDKSYVTTIYVTKMDPKNQTLTFLVNGQELVLAITSEAFEKNHFINPTYKTTFNGEEITYSMKGGKACYNFSANLAFMILGAYLH